MQASQLLPLLGRPSTDPAVDRALDQFKIRARPEVETDDEDPEDPLLETQDWVKNRKAGIEFGFEEEDSFLGKPTKANVQPAYTMLLTQLYFYGEHPEVKPFVDRLPLNLLLSDDRATVRSKLAQYEHTRRSYKRDTWELPDYQLIVSYVEDGARIGFVLCTLRVPPSPEPDDIVSLPAIDDLMAVLGKRMDDRALRKVVRPLNIDNYLEDQDDIVVALMRSEFGIELQFGGVRSMDASALTLITLYRDREEDAHGWKGALPRKLEFQDSPETLFRKIPEKPDDLSEGDFEGAATWRFPDYNLKVKYSTMFNWLLSVQIYVPKGTAAF